MSITDRLPALPDSTDKGFVYVTRRGDAYKVGFSRKGLARRVRESGGDLVLVIPTGPMPGAQGTKPGDKREWFALSDEDLDWLRGLKTHILGTQDVAVSETG